MTWTRCPHCHRPLQSEEIIEIDEDGHVTAGHDAAALLGRRGGLAGKGKTSPAKAAAARANGAKGGRPRKEKRP